MTLVDGGSGLQLLFFFLIFFLFGSSWLLVGSPYLW